MRIKIDCVDNVMEVEYSEVYRPSSIAINLFDLSPYNSIAAYNVQFSLSSEILAPGHIHRPTLEPGWTNKRRNFCFILFIIH